MRNALFAVLGLLLLHAGIAQAQDAAVADELRPSRWRERYSSARVEALRRQIASGSASTDTFWAEVAKEGTPLIEPSNENDKHQLVTFLWRGNLETRSVLVVIDPFTAARPQDYAMRRVEQSDVWYLTVRMPRDARFMYRASVNDQAGPDFFGDLKLDAAVADPLNQNSWLGHSAVELPGAPPQPWIVRTPGTPEGKIERHRITSSILSNERDIWVYTPERGRELAERSPADDPTDDRHIREEMEDRAVLEGNSLQRLFISRSRLPLTFYMNAGSFEAQFWGGQGGINGTLEANRHMRDVLLAKGYEVHYREFVGGHDYLSWRGLIADGLIALIGTK